MTWLYHGTSRDNVRRIQRYGLDSKRTECQHAAKNCRRDAFYASERPQVALAFAMEPRLIGGGDNWTLLQFMQEMATGDHGCEITDDAIANDYPGKNTRWQSKEVRGCVIPPEHIRACALTSDEVKAAGVERIATRIEHGWLGLTSDQMWNKFDNGDRVIKRVCEGRWKPLPQYTIPPIDNSRPDH